MNHKRFYLSLALPFLTSVFFFFLSSQKNSVPEAMIPGLYVVKEDNKIILQIPNSGQSAVCADQQLKSPC